MDRLENPDRIDLDVCLANQVLDFALRVAARVVAAVGKHEDGLAGVARLLHVVHRHVEGVQQRRAALRLPLALGVLAMLAFHAHLLWLRVADGSLLDAQVAARWLGAFALGLGLWRLYRATGSLTSGTKMFLSQSAPISSWRSS